MWRLGLARGPGAWTATNFLRAPVKHLAAFPREFVDRIELHDQVHAAIKDPAVHDRVLASVVKRTFNFGIFCRP